jgi:hypothetical protein
MWTIFAIPLLLSCIVCVFSFTTTASTVLSSRSSISDPFTTPTRLLHIFQHRDVDMILTDNLIAVLEANGSTSSSSSKAWDLDVTSTYRKVTTWNATALDDLYKQSAAVGISTTTRASLACAAASLVFVSETMTLQSSNYTAKEQKDWFVPLIFHFELFFHAWYLTHTPPGHQIAGSLRPTFSRSRVPSRLSLLCVLWLPCRQHSQCAALATILIRDSAGLENRELYLI